MRKLNPIIALIIIFTIPIGNIKAIWPANAVDLWNLATFVVIQLLHLIFLISFMISRRNTHWAPIACLLSTVLNLNVLAACFYIYFGLATDDRIVSDGSLALMTAFSNAIGDADPSLFHNEILSYIAMAQRYLVAITAAFFVGAAGSYWSSGPPSGGSSQGGNVSRLR